MTGLSQQEADALLKQYGYNETEEKKTPAWKMFLKKFWNLSAWMLEILIILSLFLGHYPDAAIIFVVLIINSVTVFLQDRRALNAVDALKKQLRIFVNTLRDGEWKTIPARELVPGDVVSLRPGDFIAADLKLTEGSITVNQASLTGESADIEKKEQDEIYAGSVITKGEANATVTSTGIHTYYGKTIDLLKTALPKSHMDEVIEKLLKWLSAIIGGMLLIAMIVSIYKGISIISILPLMVILFMNAIPVALSVMFSVSNAIGARQLLKQGVLVTRMNAPNDAANMDILCVDKTGTLTLNKLSVTEIYPAQDFTKEEVVYYGMQASQEVDQDAIDKAFVEAAKKDGRENRFTRKTYTPFTPQTRHTEALITSGNETYTVYKGSLEVILQLTGTELPRQPEWEKIGTEAASKSYRTIAVAKSTSGQTPQLVGVVALNDPPRKESQQLVTELHQLGVSVIMLTGDALPIAIQTAQETGIGTTIIKASGLGDNNSIAEKLERANGVAEVYPEDKYKIVKALQAKGHIVGMTGDGVNDAPALQQAEVGIAVNNAVDVAKKSASIILTEDGLQGIISPIRIGRVMLERIHIWILNKLSRTVLKIGFIVLALILFGQFVVTTTVMLLLLLVTDFVIISVSTDKVPISPEPDRWNITPLARIGVVQGLLMMIEALLLLFIGWHFFHLDTKQGQLYTFCFIILLFYSLLSVFVVREKRHFWNSRPGTIDSLILGADFAGGIIISLTGLIELKPLPFPITLFVIAYVLLTSLTINDYVKYRMHRKKVKSER